MDDGKTWQIISPDLTAFENDKQVVPGAPITRDVTGEEYYSTIYAIRESPIKEGVIWVGANDEPVHITQDGGASWINVTPKMPIGGRVDAVEPSPHDPAKAYISILRYQLNDYKPYIYKTEDYGITWTLITDGTNGIPTDFPTRVVREDPEKEGILYAGTEFGAFVSLNDGISWIRFEQFPTTPVTDMKIHQGDLVISTMGRGFWILDDLTSLRGINDIGSREVVFFQPKDGLRLRMRVSSDKNGSEYSQSGVKMDYYLAHPDQEVSLEIYNENENLVRKYVSGKYDPKVNTERNMSTEFSNAPASGGLPNDKGMNRFTWNMRHRSGWSANETQSYSGNGPMVRTGTYKAVLKLGDEVQEKEFDVLLDPRVTLVSDEDVAAQEAFSLQIRDFQDQVNQLIAEVDEERESLKNTLDKESVRKKHNGKKKPWIRFTTN